MKNKIESNISLKKFLNFKFIFSRSLVLLLSSTALLLDSHALSDSDDINSKCKFSINTKLRESQLFPLNLDGSVVSADRFKNNEEWSEISETPYKINGKRVSYSDSTPPLIGRLSRTKNGLSTQGEVEKTTYSIQTDWDKYENKYSINLSTTSDIIGSRSTQPVASSTITLEYKVDPFSADKCVFKSIVFSGLAPSTKSGSYSGNRTELNREKCKKFYESSEKYRALTKSDPKIDRSKLADEDKCLHDYFKEEYSAGPVGQLTDLLIKYCEFTLEESDIIYFNSRLRPNSARSCLNVNGANGKTTIENTENCLKEVERLEREKIEVHSCLSLTEPEKRDQEICQTRYTCNYGRVITLRPPGRTLRTSSPAESSNNNTIRTPYVRTPYYRISR